jgi:hypothetical protein
MPSLQSCFRALLCAAALLAAAGPSMLTAGEIVLGAAYTPEELAKVRAWERTWEGKKIDRSNVDGVAEFLPPSWADLYKNPEKWGGREEGFYFVVAPYQQVFETKNFVAATQKYAPLVKRNPDGTIANYTEIAGRPFPDPKTGLEMAYDFEFNNSGDTAHYTKTTANINPRMRTERPAEQDQWEFYFIHRTELDPRPAYPEDQNKNGFHRGYFFHMFKPAEFINTRMYTMRYIDASKADDMYMWYAQYRRIRRLSSSQRTDSIDGTDLIYDDEYFWDGQLVRNTYDHQGSKELLCNRHQDLRKASRAFGQAVTNNLGLERCKTLVVNVVSKDPNYIYSKRIWYLDPESFIILWTEIYDSNGRFWKCFMQNTNVITTALGEQKHFIVGSQYVDFQRVHTGVNNQQSKVDIQLSVPADPSIFSVKNLQRTF